ncbi:MAG: hypothetical protein JJU03_12005 [Idiomarina sp.]|nr:hypothetical protein [Idiomarina sp.]
MKKLVADEAVGRRGAFKSVLVFITLIVVTLAQWNGARMLMESVYSNFVTHFTHHLEYKQLEHVRVGANLTYLESIFGAAQLIKASTTEPALDYRYYHSNKFLLTLAVDEDRIEGFQILSKLPGFQPNIILSDQRLNDVPFAQLHPQVGDFITDNSNLRFYLERHQLGRLGLFMNLFPAHVSYGAEHRSSEANTNPQLLDDLNRSYLLGEEEALSQHLTELRLQATPNSYSFGRISLETAADMMLTTYEFRAYFE